MARSEKIALAKSQFRGLEDSTYLLVPQPPLLTLKKPPSNSKALVTVVVGAESERIFTLTHPYMEKYAKRVGADLIILRWGGHPEWSMSAKFMIPRVLDHYERIAYVDADVLLRPEAVNLFESCSPQQMGVYDELPTIRKKAQYGRENAYKQFRAVMGFRSMVKTRWMVNCGVMVIPQSHKELLLPPTQPIPISHCAEQDHTNARLIDSGLQYKLLDEKYNYEWWVHSGFPNPPSDAILHWSGMGKERYDDILRWTQRYPLVTVHGENWFTYAGVYEQVVKDASQTGNFAIVGCWMGRCSLYMAQAIRRWEKNIHLHCIDTWGGVPDDIEQHSYYSSSIEKYGDPYLMFLQAMSEGNCLHQITPHRGESVEVSKTFNDSSLDFVFIDADHSESAVRADIQAWLPKVKIGGILAGHDYHLQGVKKAVDSLLSSFQIVGDNWPCWVYHK